MKKFKSFFTVLRLIFYIVFLAFFALIPIESVEEGSLCTWYNSFALICPTCGYTRGFTSFMHGFIDKAFSYNQTLVLFAVPITFFVMAQDVYTIILRNIRKVEKMSFIEFLLRPDIYLGK